MHLPEIRALRSEDLSWILKAHVEFYSTAHRFDDSFGALVAELLDQFDQTHDPACEAAWVAWDGSRRLGCIFCVQETAHIARLRMFLIVPEAQGQGLGSALLQRCMGFARTHGYSEMVLGTHESHEAACALYKKTGWQMETTGPVISFGQSLIEQTWRYRF
ncbi:MAG: GNAT family N-acetyltransferase [Pseudomonadota bacterium]